MLLIPLLLTNPRSRLNDSREVRGAGQCPFVSGYPAQRILGNLGQLNLILDTEPDAADSGVTQQVASNTLR